MTESNDLEPRLEFVEQQLQGYTERFKQDIHNLQVRMSGLVWNNHLSDLKMRYHLNDDEVASLALLSSDDAERVAEVFNAARIRGRDQAYQEMDSQPFFFKHFGFLFGLFVGVALTLYFASVIFG